MLNDFKKAERKDSMFSSPTENFEEEEEPTFTKKDLLSIVRNKQLPQIIESILSSISAGLSKAKLIKVY